MTKHEVKQEKRQEVKKEIKENNLAALQKMKDYATAFHEDAGYVQNYFAPLTDKVAKKARNIAVATAQKTLGAAREQLMKEYRAASKAKTPLTTDAITTRIDTMVNVFHDAVIQYVDPTKTTTFESFIAGKKDVIAQNYKIRTDTKVQNQTRKDAVK